MNETEFLADVANADVVKLTVENVGLRQFLWAAAKQAGGKLEVTMADILDGPEKAKFVLKQPAPDRPGIMTIETVE